MAYNAWWGRTVVKLEAEKAIKTRNELCQSSRIDVQSHIGAANLTAGCVDCVWGAREMGISTVSITPDW